jgi:hypothetical protein
LALVFGKFAETLDKLKEEKKNAIFVTNIKFDHDSTRVLSAFPSSKFLTSKLDINL